ncbi:MAG: flagellar biosynthesis protein FlgC [Alphaproteobacteria bacterium]|nr:MAG: flagellar biosynthesis protein FlgC [Alphaproteobacteria bacterium]
MFKALQTSVSGLIASSTRLNVAASNIVNARVASSPKGTTGPRQTFRAGYSPQRVAQTTTAGGGVRATGAPVSPASLSVYDPTSPFANEQGAVDMPNVSLPVEISELRRARHAYEANAKVIKTLDDTFKTLLKI